MDTTLKDMARRRAAFAFSIVAHARDAGAIDAIAEEIEAAVLAERERWRKDVGEALLADTNIAPGATADASCDHRGPDCRIRTFGP